MTIIKSNIFFLKKIEWIKYFKRNNIYGINKNKNKNNHI